MAVFNGVLAAADARRPCRRRDYRQHSAGLGSAIGVGLVGMKASEAVGRNPGAFGKIIAIAILGMALAEAIVFYAILMK